MYKIKNSEDIIMLHEHVDVGISNIESRKLLNNLFYVIRVLGLYPDVVTHLAGVPGGRHGPAPFVSRIVRFARTVSAGIDLTGQSHLEAELVRLERFCVDCQALDG